MNPLEQSRHFYVYVIFRPNGVPCYIGKGQGPRCYKHRLATSNRHLANIYAAAGGMLPVAIVRGHLSQEEAFVTERALIAAIGREVDGGPLVNQSAGGDGGHTGCRHSEEFKQARARRSLGHIKSAETREKLSLALKGRKPAESTILAVKKAKTGVPQSEETSRKISATMRGRGVSPELPGRK